MHKFFKDAHDSICLIRYNQSFAINEYDVVETGVYDLCAFKVGDTTCREMYRKVTCAENNVYLSEGPYGWGNNANSFPEGFHNRVEYLAREGNGIH